MLYLTTREVCSVYLACPVCPVWAACLALQASPAADVLAAVFVPIFAAVARVFVQRAAIAVVVFVPAVAVFVLAAAPACRPSEAAGVDHSEVVAFARPEAAFDQFAAAAQSEVAADRLAAVFVRSNCSARAFAFAELVAARFSGVPGPVSGVNPGAVARVFVRVGDLRCRHCLAVKRAGGRCSRADCPGSWEHCSGDSNCPESAHLPGLAGLAGW